MTESQSKRFIAALEPVRDRLYGLALMRAESPGAAEGLLQRAVRQQIRAAAEGAGTGEPAAAIEAEVLKSAVVAVAAAEAVMPADVWARLTAAMQIEAARAGAGATGAGGKGVNPESVLLLPDPLLAPKRPAVQEDLFEGLNLSPPSRFLVAAGIAIVLGVVLTIFIVTRHAGAPAGATQPATAAASLPAATQEAATAPARANTP